LETEQSPTSDLVREFVIAGHGNHARVKELLEQHPQLLDAAYSWSATDQETAIQGAAQVGNVPVAEYLLSKGVPLDICTAAMLGRKNEVMSFLDKDPQGINAKGAHKIPLLPHAALSGNVDLVQMLFKKGATEGMSLALNNAVSRRHHKVAKWLLENGRPDLTWKNYEGKTVLAVALDGKDEAMAQMLKEHGAA